MRLFQSRGYNMHAVENATQALAAIKREPYGMIICEHLLQDMNGLNFFKRINNSCHEAMKILITVYGNNAALEDISGKYIDYVLTKPLSVDEIEKHLCFYKKKER